jgi:hypothetical protein
MSGLVPVNATANSTVDIEDSCNDCCSCCWPRRVKSTPVALRRQDASNVSLTSLKVHSNSMPIITQSAEDEWEIAIDGRKISADPVADSIKQEHGLK